MHCGFCLPACPTYQLWGREADSPRGRIYLMKAVLDGRAVVDEHFTEHIDRCLGCMGCLTACPSGVRYDRLIEAVRPQVENHPRSAADRWYRHLIFALFPHAKRLKWIARALRAAQLVGAQRAIRATGLASLLPPRIAALEQLTPVVSSMVPDKLPPVVAPIGSKRRKVGLLLGCVQRVFFPEVNAATARVLAAEGCELIIPDAQECCGALMLHGGRIDEAAEAARKLIDEFNRVDIDAIVVNAAGCGSAMKSYGELLRDDPEYAAAAQSFAARCVDVSELLADLEPRAPRHPMPICVAYHDACHLNHAQGIKQQPRQILRTIPQLELREIEDSDTCCGSAGVYNLLEPAAASALRDRKVARVIQTKANVLVSSNPGCLLQIASGLERSGHKMRTMHLVELLDASMRAAAVV